MLYDKNFLLELDKCKNKIIYAKITALTFAENPIQTIEGRVTQGSINIDGASAVRRTCSLSIVAQDFDYKDYCWGLNSKFKLEIGVQNFIDSNYPEIIWFKQGIYLITGFNTSRSVNNFTISISGKDKMSLLNGDIGGVLESSVDFGKIEEENNDGIWTIRSLPIVDIIKNAVHVYGKEPYHNIIINDLDICGRELLEYRYDSPLYLWKNATGNSFEYGSLDGRKKVKYTDGENDWSGSYQPLSQIDNDYFLTPNLSGIDDNETIFEFEEKKNEYYKILKIQYGETAGYRATDLTYAGDLIAKAGESITSILDKIKNMLVEYEYFYDVEGRFVFQKKKSFINTLWAPAGQEQTFVEYQPIEADYVFSGGELITAFNNNPNLLNLRNDFSVWGERETISGAKVPIHMRYAIDLKPEKYVSIQVDDDDPQVKKYNQKYNLNISGQSHITYERSDIYLKEDDNLIKCDWREIIYQMAKDYYQYNFLNDFELRVAAANPWFCSGQTGYEQYYIDIQGFWRQLYFPIEDELDKIEDELDKATEEKRIVYLQNKRSELNDEKENYYVQNDIDSGISPLRLCWNKTIYNAPESLLFWFDFLPSSGGELQQFNVKNIGTRSKVVNETSIKSIYFRETPDVEFVDKVNGHVTSSGTSLIQIGDFDNMFSISGQGKSAKDRIDELLNQHSYCIESASITAIPVYYLEPNSRIYLNDEKSNIIGYYNVSKITLPLAYNGTMSLTTTKIQDSLL